MKRLFLSWGLILTLTLSIASCTSKSIDREENHAISSFVYNGTETVGQQWASVVSLTRDGEYFCSGVLITPTIVLTAAHCILDYGSLDSYSESTQVYVGNGSLNHYSGDFEIEQVGIHPKYMSEVRDIEGRGIYDFGYIILKREVPKEVVSIIPPLQNKAEIEDMLGQPNRDITIVGFGKTKYGQGGRKRFARNYVARFTEKEFFEGDREHYHCNGDSGGGVFTRLSSGELRLIGTVSRSQKDHLNRCVDKAIAGQSHWGASWVYSKIASAYEADLKLEEALIWYQKALSISSLESAISLHLDIARVYRGLGDDYQSARHVTIAEELRDASELVFASSEGSVEKLNELLEKGIDINTRLDRGETALMLAVKHGHLNIVELLAEHGADGDLQAFNGQSALMIAVDKGFFVIADYLINKGLGSSVKMKSANGTSNFEYLIKACQQGDLSVVKYLVYSGADLKKVNEDGTTILMKTVAKSNDLSLINYLVGQGLDINATSNFGYTPLSYAMHREDNDDVIKYLLEHGANVNAKDSLGNTILIQALKMIDMRSSKNSILLIEKGVDVNAKNNRGKTALMIALENSYFEVVDYLLDKGVDINASDDNGTTTLHIAVKKNDFLRVKNLIALGAKIDFQNNIGETALFIAIAKGRFEIAEYLIDEGADLNIVDKNGSTVLHISISKNYVPIIQRLIDLGVDINTKNNYGETAFFQAVLHSPNFELANYLMTRGANINSKNSEEMTALMAAARKGNLDSVKHLIDLGADINAIRFDGKTALMIAGDHFNWETAKYLISKNKTLYLKSNEVSAIFLRAIRFNKFDFAKYLVEQGADLNCKDEYGTTPVSLAFQNEEFDFVRYLVEKGADVNVELHHPQTILDKAIIKQNFEMVKYFISKGAVQGEMTLKYAMCKGNLDIIDELITHGFEILSHDGNPLEDPCYKYSFDKAVQMKRASVIAFIRNHETKSISEVK